MDPISPENIKTNMSVLVCVREREDEGEKGDRGAAGGAVARLNQNIYI